MVLWYLSQKDDTTPTPELPPGDDDWWDEDDLTMEEVEWGPSIGGQGTSTTIPNISGRAAGYNDLLWTGPLEVQKVLFSMGYQSTDPVNAPPSPSAVRAFQRDYNTASDLDFLDAVGELQEDGKAGKNTLNAMERVNFGLDGRQPQDYIRWAEWKTEFGLW